VALTQEELENIAQLARLRFTEQEIPDFASNLSRILDFVRQLDAAETEGVAPMAHPLDEPQRLRPDVVTERDQRDLFQANASSVEAGLYLVPKVIE
jgi:aspartyl-tRNA(Asn)/glutamyl-tRNA(Gln) amidotransferase subunit C